jgi:hypothetical protein
MKLLYKPFGIIAGLVSGWLGKTVFKRLWAKIDEREPPGATTEEASYPKVIGAAVLKAGVMAGVGVAVERAGAQAFHYLTGIWPGEKEAEESS